MTTISIRPLVEDDWPAVWNIMQPVIRSGESYPYAMDMNSDGGRHMWIELTDAAYVAQDDSGQILGTYYIKPNQPTLGAHVANCGYLVAEAARGQGVATKLCIHSEKEAVRLGYRAMQFNLVVASNTASVKLWTKMGYEKVGVLTGAFLHARLGYVDAIVMYKVLVS